MRHHTLGLRNLLLLTLLLSFSASCSLVLDLKGCEINEDCPDQMVCSQDRLCSDPPATISCADEQICPDGMTCNDLQVCQPPSSLFAAPCEQASGDIDAEDAFIIGVLLPLSGEEEGFGRPLFQAIQLAQ